jgi:hypothetical protein
VRKLLLVIVVAVAWLDGHAQSALPPCPMDVAPTKWTACVGTLKTKSGTYEGEFRNGLYEGRGKFTVSLSFLFRMTNPENWSYEGDWVQGQRNGKGQSFLESVELLGGGRTRLVMFAGEWKDGKRHGSGVEYNIAGIVTKTGEWLNGDYVGPTSNSPQTVVETVPVAPSNPIPVANEPPTKSKPERRVALVIGNAAYRVSPLTNAVNDSSDVAKALRSRGFKVIERTNSPLADMRRAAREFADELVSSDVALVYYSGHGLEVNGRNYFIPIGADIQREFEVADQAYDVNQITDMMQSVPSVKGQRVNIMIVDACRDNPLARSWRSSSRGLAKMDAPTGTFIAFSTAPGRVAADGTGRNSPFTKNFLKALNQPNQPIERVFKAVRRAVLEETGGLQTPWENSSLIGDFYFTESP